MTWVKSRLVAPSGAPIEGACVKATLVSKPTWLADSTSQVVSRAMTHTGPDGMWRLNLIPYTAYESQLAACSYYHIIEGTNPPTVTDIRVPEVGDGEELWMRDLVFDPDPCSGSGGWTPINTLARLHDVDAGSLALAKPGDFLVLLPNGKWGAAHGPMPLTIAWTPVPEDLLSIQVVVAGFGGAGARVGFGDGSEEQTVYSYEPITHTYAGPGTYILTATDVAWPAFTSSVKVGIKDHLARAYAFRDGDDDWRVLLWLNEAADDTVYSINWGDGTMATETSGQDNGLTLSRPREPHQYTNAGTYGIVVTDVATKRQTLREVEVGDLGVLITYDSPLRPRTDWFWMVAGAMWEFEPEGSSPSTGVVPASGLVSIPASEDVSSGDFGFEVREVLGGQIRRTATRRFTVPTQSDPLMDVAMTWRANDDPINVQTVSVTPMGARTRCTVEWGDGSASELVDPGQAISHRYQLPAPANGWRLRLTETGIVEPRIWTRVLGEPRHIGTPTMSGRTRGAVTLDIAGIDSDYNENWYSVTWESTSPPNPIGAIGRSYPASHVYTSPGSKTITVDGPGMRAPITRQIDVVFYPTPTIAVAEERDVDNDIVDPTHMTARINVDNIPSGGPCVVDLGDGSTPRQCDETDSFAYQYQAAGTYDLIVRGVADPTAKGRFTATVPFEAERTLFYELTAPPGNYEVTCTLTSQDPGKTVHVRWESGGPWNIVSPGGQVSYFYPLDGTYEVVVAYTDDSESWPTTIQVPWPPT